MESWEEICIVIIKQMTENISSQNQLNYSRSKQYICFFRPSNIEFSLTHVFQRKLPKCFLVLFFLFFFPPRYQCIIQVKIGIFFLVFSLYNPFNIWHLLKSQSQISKIYRRIFVFSGTCVASAFARVRYLTARKWSVMSSAAVYRRGRMSGLAEDGESWLREGSSSQSTLHI